HTSERCQETGFWPGSDFLLALALDLVGPWRGPRPRHARQHRSTPRPAGLWEAPSATPARRRCARRGCAGGAGAHGGHEARTEPPRRSVRATGNAVPRLSTEKPCRSWPPSALASAGSSSRSSRVGDGRRGPWPRVEASRQDRHRQKGATSRSWSPCFLPGCASATQGPLPFTPRGPERRRIGEHNSGSNTSSNGPSADSGSGKVNQILQGAHVLQLLRIRYVPLYMPSELATRNRHISAVRDGTRNDHSYRTPNKAAKNSPPRTPDGAASDATHCRRGPCGSRPTRAPDGDVLDHLRHRPVLTHHRVFPSETALLTHATPAIGADQTKATTPAPVDNPVKIQPPHLFRSTFASLLRHSIAISSPEAAAASQDE
ncbi:unnamed protein product, partial [Prorocentrum cordatum]